MTVEKLFMPTRIPYQYPASQEQVRINRLVWVDALKSGNYEQGMFYLRTKEDTYCCLGVACDLFGDPWNKTFQMLTGDETSNSTVYSSLLNDGSNPPGWVRRAFGLADMDVGRLTTWNDSGDSFETIADRIRELPIELSARPDLVYWKEMRDSRVEEFGS